MEKTFNFGEKHLDILNSVRTKLDDAMEYIRDQQDNEESQMNIGYLAGKAFTTIEYAYELIDSLMSEAGEVIEGDEDGN